MFDEKIADVLSSFKNIMGITIAFMLYFSA